MRVAVEVFERLGAQPVGRPCGRRARRGVRAAALALTANPRPRGPRTLLARVRRLVGGLAVWRGVAEGLTQALILVFANLTRNQPPIKILACRFPFAVSISNRDPGALTANEPDDRQDDERDQQQRYEDRQSPATGIHMVPIHHVPKLWAPGDRVIRRFSRHAGGELRRPTTR